VPIEAGGGESAGMDEAEPAGELGPAAIPDEEAATYEVTFEREGETLAVRENQTILEAGEAAGMDLPYSCRQGQCISCAGHITSGGNAEEYVIHDTQEMLEDTELDEGYTLTCVAYPTRDLSIESGEAP
jgi:Ferredoxin